MAVWSEVGFKDVKPDRFDADFFRSCYMENIKLLKKTGSVVTLGKTFGYIKRGMQPEYSANGEIRVLRSVNVGFLSFNENRQEYVTSKYKAGHLRGQVDKNDILVTSTGVGTLGRTSIWHSQESAYCDGHITILRYTKFDPYFVALYLNTKYGMTQFDQHYRGSSGQIEIYPFDISKFIIPNLSEKYQAEIGDMVRLSFKQLDNSQTLYTQAQSLLEHELGLDKLSFTKPLSYETNFGEIAASARIDPEHYFPAFDSFQQNLPAKKLLSPLSQHLTFCQRGKQPLYTNRGVKVINSKHVLTNKITLEGNRLAKCNPVPAMNIVYQDVLINGTGRGTIGRAAAYLETDTAVPDNHVTILRSNTLDPVYLAVYLNSKAGQMQVEKHLRGSSGQIELYPFDIRKFLVWAAPGAIQKEIRRLHEKALSAEKESHHLLAQAKHRVETLIEQAVRK